MTTTDYFRKLCEICGIKPIYKCRNVPCLNFCVGGDCQLKEFEACNPLHCSEYVPDTESKKWKDGIAIYPKFTHPENFVKLEEIMLAELAKQRLTVVKWVHYFSDNTLMHEYILITKCGHKIKFKHNGIEANNWFVERENRTECLILFILWKVLPICGDSLKQAIREQEWSYV